MTKQSIDFKDYYYKYKALKYYLKNNRNVVPLLSAPRERAHALASIEKNPRMQKISSSSIEKQIKGGSNLKNKDFWHDNKNKFLQFLKGNKDATEKKLQKYKDLLKALKNDVMKKNEQRNYPTEQDIHIKEIEIEELEKDINKLEKDIETLNDLKFNDDLQYNRDAMEVYNIIKTKNFSNFLRYINSTERLNNLLLLNNLLITYQIQPILNNEEYYPFYINSNKAKLRYIISNLFKIKLDENTDPRNINLKNVIKSTEEEKKSNNNLKMDDLTSIKLELQNQNQNQNQNQISNKDEYTTEFENNNIQNQQTYINNQNITEATSKQQIHTPMQDRYHEKYGPLR